MYYTSGCWCLLRQWPGTARKSDWFSGIEKQDIYWRKYYIFSSYSKSNFTEDGVKVHLMHREGQTRLYQFGPTLVQKLFRHVDLWLVWLVIVLINAFPQEGEVGQQRQSCAIVYEWFPVHWGWWWLYVSDAGSQSPYPCEKNSKLALGLSFFA